MINKCTSRKKPPIKHVFFICRSVVHSLSPSLQACFFNPIRASRFTNPFCGQGNFAPSDSSVAARLSSDNWSQLHWRKSSKVIENPYDRHRKSYDPRTPKAPRFLIESMESNQLSAIPPNQLDQPTAAPFSCDSSRLRPGWFWGNVSPETMGILMDFDE